MPIAEKVGPFRVISHIAKGGMGRVYLAEHAEKRRHVAIKVLPEKFLTDTRRSQYLEREVKIAQKLRHPNVVDIYGLLRENGIGYLIMEYLDGGNLRRHIKSRELSFAKILEVILKICEGLHYIHHHKFEDGRFHSIIHMDIKPENILLSKNGRLKVADFGLSLTEDFWTLRRSKTRAGTPFYMSPEQIRGKNLDIRTDIYSLGLVIYELLTGQLPYKGQDREMYLKMVISHKTRPAAPSYINNKIPRQFDEITMKALAKETEARYQTVAEMMLDLQRLAQTLMPDDLTEEFRFMRSVKLNKVEATTTEVPVGKVNVGAVTSGTEPRSEKKEAHAESPDTGVEDSMADESAGSADAESKVDSDDSVRLRRDLLQLHREPIHIEKPAVARAKDAPEKESEEPVGEFLPVAEVEPETTPGQPEEAEPVPASLSENSGLVDGEPVDEAEPDGNGELTGLSESELADTDMTAEAVLEESASDSADRDAGNTENETAVMPEEPSRPDRASEMEEATSVEQAVEVSDNDGDPGDMGLGAEQTGEDSGSDGFSVLDVDEIESFIFIGRKKG